MIKFVKVLTVRCDSTCEDHENDHKNQVSLNTDDNRPGTRDRVSGFLPKSRGVIEMISHDSKTVMLAATGDMRGFVASRFNEDQRKSSHADLAPITETIRAYPTGSSFESDWIVHERARACDPELYTKINEQSRFSILVLNSESSTWEVQSSNELFVDQEINQNQELVGPIRTLKSARALGELIDDQYELCRFPKELAQIPNGNVCVYHEMGRCPGVCAGKEPIELFRARFDDALNRLKSGCDWWIDALKSELQEASLGMDFERAQSIHDRIELIESQLKEKNGRLIQSLSRSLGDHQIIIVSPSIKRGWGIVWGFGIDGLVPMMSVNENSGEIFDTIESISDFELQRMKDSTIDQRWIDRFALLVRHWMIKPTIARRRRLGIIDLGSERAHKDRGRKMIVRAISEAIAPVNRSGSDDHDDEDRTHIVR